MGSLLGINRDRASVNQAAGNDIAPLYLGYLDLQCCPHSLVKRGEYFAFAELTEFKDRLMIALNSSALSVRVLPYVTSPYASPRPLMLLKSLDLVVRSASASNNKQVKL